MTTTGASSATLSDLLSQAGWAHRLAQALTRDEDEAEDLVQETWTAAVRRPPSADRPLRPWLGTVLRRTWLKRAESERRRTAREESASLVGGAPSPEELLERMEAQKRLANLVTALEEPKRSRAMTVSATP